MCITVTPRGPSQNKPLLPWGQHKNPARCLCMSADSRQPRCKSRTEKEGGKTQPLVTLQELVGGYGLFESSSSEIRNSKFLHVTQSTPTPRGMLRSWESLPKHRASSSWRGEEQRERWTLGLGQEELSADPAHQDLGLQKCCALSCIYFHLFLFPPHAALSGLMPSHHRH